MNRVAALIAGLTVLALAGCGGVAPSGATMSIFLADAPLPGVTAVNVTIERVEANLDGGWIEISATQQTYDLLTLTQTDTLIATASMPPGNYSQIRLFISKVTVEDESGTHDAKVPSGSKTGLKLNVNSTVGDFGDVAILLDFNVEKSLVKRDSGEYILKPVIKAVLKQAVGSVRGIAIHNGYRQLAVLVTAIYIEGNSYPIGTEVNTSATVDDGLFTIWALPPGVYRIELIQTVDGETVYFAVADSIVVVAEQETNIGTIENDLDYQQPPAPPQ